MAGYTIYNAFKAGKGLNPCAFVMMLSSDAENEFFIQVDDIDEIRRLEYSNAEQGDIVVRYYDGEQYVEFKGRKLNNGRVNFISEKVIGDKPLVNEDLVNQIKAEVCSNTLVHILVNMTCYDAHFKQYYTDYYNKMRELYHISL